MSGTKIDAKSYFASLHARRGAAERMIHQKVPHDGWSPETGKCHDNVNYWVNLNPHLRAIRGWMIVSEDEFRCVY
jgi:hypothetical protein